MRVAVIGAGNIGGTLARKWVAAGHDVRIGARDPQSDRTQSLVAALDRGVKVQPIEQAASEAEAVLFALPGAAMADTVAGLGDALAGKPVMDATNNLAPGGPLNSFAALTAAAPRAHLFRAFSTLGWENFANPQLGGTQVDLFFCGPDGSAAELVRQLITDVGLRPIYVGGSEQVGVVDGLASLWFALVFGQKRPRRTAFHLIEE